VGKPCEHDWRDVGGEAHDERSQDRIAVKGIDCPSADIGSSGADDWLPLGEELPHGGLRRVLALWGVVPLPFFRAFAADRP
jgi:hypothetical protein